MKTLLTLVVLLVPSFAMAQTYTTSSQFKWDAPTNAMDAADAAAFTYRAYINGSPTGVILNFVACLPAVAPDVVFSCSAPMAASLLPAVNKRKTSVYVTAEDTTTPVSGESGPSNVFIVNRKPNNPTTLRNQQ